ncbi:hypothetical protein BROUX41_005836 [Berkeleyomyces rouxiae]|uniref:uncharacterized protein n=1 Tax=Berkeleyomyces rouxiae TaxID=2035830 RepID=UPI003B7F9E48
MRFSFLAAMALATVSQAGTFEGISSEYSFDLKEAYNPKWMADVPNEAQVSSLSIPGTHNSMALIHGYNMALLCQNIYLKKQLEAGIRYLDVSGRVSDTKLRDMIEIYHKNEHTGYTFDTVLKEIFDFLQENPSEGIILRLHKDFKKSGTDEKFEKFVAMYLGPDSPLGERAEELLFIPSSKQGFPAPLMGELRGKLMILQDFTTKEPGRFGIPWNSPNLIVTDDKATLGHFRIKPKMKAVEKDLHAASLEMENKIHITHTSVSVGSTPYKAAGGRKGSRRGMNDRLGEYLKTTRIYHTGIIAMDFPGKKLVDEIVQLNTRFYSASQSNKGSSRPQSDSSSHYSQSSDSVGSSESSESFDDFPGFQPSPAVSFPQRFPAPPKTLFPPLPPAAAALAPASQDIPEVSEASASGSSPASKDIPDVPEDPVASVPPSSNEIKEVPAK